MRYLMTFSYDGTNFNGYQKQKNERTVQQEIENVLSKIFNTNITISASGRTDSKVHAINQKAHFDCLKKMNLNSLTKAMNSLLPNDIYVKKINHVKQDFHARYDVVSKEYEYLINLKKYNPLQRNYVYQYNRSLNIELIKKASLLFEGTHNFKTFTKTTNEPKDYVRTINKITITYSNGILKLIFNGNGFLRYMVRNIVGTLISVGEEKTSINEIPEMFEKQNRVYACKTAHPEGLYLKNVFYK